MHELGWAHSVEAWDDEGLAGGLYGVAIGGAVRGRVDVLRRTDASKAAFVGLVELLRAAGDAERRLLDVQWLTPHLASLGAVEVTRAEYRRAARSAALRAAERVRRGLSGSSVRRAARCRSRGRCTKSSTTIPIPTTETRS